MSLDINLYLNDECVYDANITHNLNQMASVVSEEFYKALWRPDELGITKAHEVKPILLDGLNSLLASPEIYKEYNPSNGWGTYEGLCGVVFNYIIVCIENPNATISTWR